MYKFGHISPYCISNVISKLNDMSEYRDCTIALVLNTDNNRVNIQGQAFVFSPECYNLNHCGEKRIKFC